MNKRVLLGLLVTGCAGSGTLTGETTYGGVLPAQRGLVSYHMAAIGRPVVIVTPSDRHPLNRW